ncbi:MAG TPA: hypothetical protein VHR67_10025 [Aestuariivirgaceae bacterium]|nr:hypothetical protein [Aestuariivirgaceae bacterium]
MRLVEATVAQEAMRGHAELAAKARLQMARADPQFLGDFGNSDRLGDAGADQLAGAPDMGGSWIGRRCGRFAQHRRTEQADEPVKKDFVIGGPQQFVRWRLLVPDEINRTAKTFPGFGRKIDSGPGVDRFCPCSSGSLKLFQELSSRNLDDEARTGGRRLEKTLTNSPRDCGVAAAAHDFRLAIAYETAAMLRKEHGQERTGKGFSVKARRCAYGPGQSNTPEVHFIATQTKVGVSTQRYDLARQGAVMSIGKLNVFVGIAGLKPLGRPTRCRLGHEAARPRRKVSEGGSPKRLR